MSVGYNMDELRSSARDWLKTLPQAQAGDPGIPVYSRSNDRVFWVEDFSLATHANKEFEKGAAEHGLYRGGAVVMVYTPLGQIVCYDDRHQWWKPIAGIAHFSEGGDLLATAGRELLEELQLISCFDQQQKRFVPQDCGDANGKISLGYTAEVVEVGGSVVIIDHVFNDENRAYECRAQWITGDIPGSWSAVSGEEWFLSGKSGIVWATLDDGSEGPHGFSGFFSGQQGHVPVAKARRHPSLGSFD